MTHTFMLAYTAYDKNGKYVRNGTIKATNRHTELDAKIFTENNLKRKYPSIHTIHIASCTPANPLDSLFGDIFR